MNTTLTDIPDHLLKRERSEHHDRKRARALCRYIEQNMAYRPTLEAVYAEKVRRGLAKPHSTEGALKAARKRRDDKRKAEGPRPPRRQRPSQSARIAAREAARGQGAA